MIVPTGIGARIGGFAGDANPAAKLLAKASDLLIVHPNIINAAMLTDISNNIAVVEGYHLDRFFAGQIALRLNVKHKIAVVVDAAANHEERELTETCMDAARTVYGLDIMPEIFYTENAIEANDLIKIKNPDTLIEACQKARSSGATAIAILAVLDEDANSSSVQNYLAGQGYDPIGTIEAKLSHLVAQMLFLPCFHAPIIRSKNKIDNKSIHPKVAAENLSESFLACVFKALQHAPQIIPLEQAHKVLSSTYTDTKELGLKQKADDITISQIANLVVPYDCCNGVPMIEAWKHEIELLCVKNNTTNLDEPATMFNIPHKVVNNYLEAAGFLLANTKDKSYINPGLFS